MEIKCYALEVTAIIPEGSSLVRSDLSYSTSQDFLASPRGLEDRELAPFGQESQELPDLISIQDHSRKSFPSFKQVSCAE